MKVEIEKFYVSKKTLLSLIDDWADLISTFKIEIIPVKDDEFIIHLWKHLVS